MHMTYKVDEFLLRDSSWLRKTITHPPTHPPTWGGWLYVYLESAAGMRPIFIIADYLIYLMIYDSSQLSLCWGWVPGQRRMAAASAL